MILRIVKMHFQTEELDGFLSYFNEIRPRIEAMPGLVQLKLYKDPAEHGLLFTLSTWLAQEHLDGYRNSPLFAEVWPRTKACFSKAPEAWSLELK